MAINVKKQIEYWLATAQRDFETAESLLKGEKHLHYCLFFCHLVIEKHLKALVVKNTKEIPPRTHDLEYLAQKAKLDLNDDNLDFLAEMNEFQLEARYPEQQLQIYKKATLSLTKRYYSKTTEFTEWLREIIES